ncbi:MAG TPA: hypothetical protein PLV10_05220 [Candidatus Latescibacteria bacterium]|nr:hypothetical protein [Candidatus Latescibacterota bacterium]
MAKEGLPFVLGGVCAGILLLAAWHGLRWEPLRILGILALVFGAFSLFFFRDRAEHLPPVKGWCCRRLTARSWKSFKKTTLMWAPMQSG